MTPSSETQATMREEKGCTSKRHNSTRKPCPVHTLSNCVGDDVLALGCLCVWRERCVCVFFCCCVVRLLFDKLCHTRISIGTIEFRMLLKSTSCHLIWISQQRSKDFGSSCHTNRF